MCTAFYTPGYVNSYFKALLIRLVYSTCMQELQKKQNKKERKKKEKKKEKNPDFKVYY